MPNGAFAIALLLALSTAAWFGVRCFALKRSLRRADRELRDIVEHLEDNRIVKMPCPDRDLEAFLRTVNCALDGIRRQSVLYARRETQLKEQIERISHDLRTPLTSIQGYLALVDAGPLSEEDRAALATVERKAESLQCLIAQFYELSRVRGEGFSLELAKVDAARLLRESIAGQYRLLEGRGTSVRASIPDGPLFARANVDAVERVFANLVHNAGKYAATCFVVDAAYEREGSAPCGGGVTVSFANDAEGIDERQVARLFEPFYTVDSARSRESSGLGLSIGRHLMERMGGALDARVEARGASTWIVFEVKLPACPSDSR